MPYSGAADATLPRNVKKLAAHKRRQWVHIFNSVLSRGGSEGSAFRQANGRVKELTGEPLPLDAFAQKDLLDILTDDDFWDDLEATIKSRMLPRFREIFDAGVDAAKGVNVPGYRAPARGQRDFLDPDPAALDDVAGQMFRNYTDDWWNGIEQTTREQLRQAIIRSSQNGTGVRQVIRDIRPLFGEVRARRIAVTETTRLFGRGAQATYRASGLGGWIWQTVEDGRVCPTCDGLSGNEYTIDQDFDPAHVTCRCFPRPLL